MLSPADWKRWTHEAGVRVLIGSFTKEAVRKWDATSSSIDRQPWIGAGPHHKITYCCMIPPADATGGGGGGGSDGSSSC